METSEENKNNKKLTKSDLNQVFFRSLFIRSALNFERQQNLGFASSMAPIIDKLYEDNKEERLEAYNRHMQLFLTNPMMGATVLGVTTAMEEQKAKGEGVTGEAINAIKTALMSPLAALGDSLISGTLRPLTAGIAATLALQGSIIGPILFFIVMTVVSVGLKYGGVHQGYTRGISFVVDAQESGIIERITELASVAALVVIGGFIPAVVELSTTIVFEADESVIDVQEQLDSLMPGMLPLLITLLMYYFIKKRNVSAVPLMIVTMIIGIVGVYIGIF